jgi:hypothetical protein
MAYDKFTSIKSTAVPLEIENVDTDQIIPARFLKATERKGFGDNLFRDWRYDKDNNLKTEFPLNNPQFQGKFLLEVKISDRDLPENMQLGPYMTMVLDVLFPVFLQIYFEIIA